MATLHTFGCSITQGFSLPDTINPILDEQGQPMTDDEIHRRGITVNWEDIHLYKPSEYAWPQVLGDQLGLSVANHARRGACFQQIARQITEQIHTISAEDTVMVMWTYLSRLSLQWPARTSVPFCNIAEPNWGWKTVILGFNKLFGLSSSDRADKNTDELIQEYIENSTKITYLDPMGVYNRYYNSLVLQQIAHTALTSTGARIIHLSVEIDPVLEQLEQSRRDLDSSLAHSYTKISDPKTWYTMNVDYNCTPVILDPRIPLSPNDMHPSVEHHQLFASYIQDRYFREAR